MVKLDNIHVDYDFKSNERRLLHLAFKAIRNGIPLYVDDFDYEANKQVFIRVGGRIKGSPRKTKDGARFDYLRREYRHRLDEGR